MSRAPVQFETNCSILLGRVSRPRAAARCHLDKAQFVRCGGGGGIGSHFDEDISRASESRALLFSSMTTHLTSEWMDGIDRPCDSRIYGAGRTPFIEIAHCISFVSSRGRGRASSSNAARGLITDATRICLRAFGVINGSPNYGPDRYRRSLPASKQRAG